MDILFDFSRNHCIGICTLLVPANLLLTLWTMLLVGRLRPPAQVYLTAVFAIFFALILLLHDFTWFTIGVVMAPTYILLAIACVCLSSNLWAIAHSTNIKKPAYSCGN
jgi:protein-S-isoprenylcysteine O-methyltransferase Ste14